MKTIFKTIAGSRLYGTNTPESDTDYKAVHLPSKRDILLRPKRPQVESYSTGQDDQKNTSEDTDVESFELQRFLKLASDMQTIPVEMLFVHPLNPHMPGKGNLSWTETWTEIARNRDKILNRNTTAFVGYCKGQAVRYSMRGDRLQTYLEVCAVLRNTLYDNKVRDVKEVLAQIDGVKIIAKQHGETFLDYVDVYGRQVPETVYCDKALDVFQKPVDTAGGRARKAQESGGADWKALYHAVRIVEQGIKLFRDGVIAFPSENRDFLMKIRSGEVEMDAILDYFDEKMAVFDEIGDNSPLAEKPDREWIDGFVMEQYEDIVRGE